MQCLFIQLLPRLLQSSFKYRQSSFTDSSAQPIVNQDGREQSLICPRWEEAAAKAEHFPAMSVDSLQQLTVEEILRRDLKDYYSSLSPSSSQK